MRVRKLRQKALPLTNDGRLSLFFVGCGSAFSKHHFQNNVLLVQGDQHLMIDCGTNTPVAFHRLGLSVSDIDSFLITHSHADHIGGLEEVLLVNRYVAQKKPELILTEAYERRLWEQSLRGGCELNEKHDGSGLTLRDFARVRFPSPADDGRWDLREIHHGPMHLRLFRTRHYPEQAQTWQDSAYSIGAVINDRVLFTGDTQFDPELVRELDEQYHFEAIFHDVQFFTGGVHCSLDELSGLPEEIRKRIYLMHYPDSYPKHEKEVKRLGMRFVKQWHFYDFPE
jgi:ribonuclease BN (tRNA processing enzyme)